MKKYNQFVNEMASYNETMRIEDLIYVMEQQPDQNFIMATNEKLAMENIDGEIHYLVSGFVKLESNGMKMDNYNFNTDFDGDRNEFYTINIENDPNNLLGKTFIGDKELPEETMLPPHKTIRELIIEAKTLNPKGLFFIPSHPVGYNAPSGVENTYEAPKVLATANITTYPLTKNGDIVSGKIGADYDFSMSGSKVAAANSFMGEGSDGMYAFIKK